MVARGGGREGVERISAGASMVVHKILEVDVTSNLSPVGIEPGTFLVVKMTDQRSLFLYLRRRKHTIIIIRAGQYNISWIRTGAFLTKALGNINVVQRSNGLGARTKAPQPSTQRNIQHPVVCNAKNNVSNHVAS